MDVFRRWSLFYRLMALSAVATAGMAVFAFWVTTEHVAARASGPHWEVAVPLIGAGLAITLALVFAATRIALRPIEELQESIVAFGHGDASARARHYPFTDAQLTRLTVAFNEMADALVEKQAKIAEMSSRVVAAQEEERRRLARDLHDGTAQDLATLLLSLKQLERKTSMHDVRESLPALRERLGESVEGLRRLARSMRPSVLDDLGLAAAIQSSVAEFERATAPRITLEVGVLDARLPPDAETVLYRVFQEAMLNVVKHAHASNVLVRAGRSPQGFRLAVEDDGVGFDPADPAARERGIGLFSMAERLALVGGALHVHSVRGQGTAIVAEVPLHEEQP